MIAGEVLWPLAPLDLDAAAALFTERARAIVPSFEVADAAHTTVRTLCERLDCLPLAIELAAARMRAFSPDDLLSRLDDRFRLLTVGARTAFPRQQTLRAVIDWSYDLLFDDERRLFERLSVFAGRFSPSAAEAVCADETLKEDEVADLLARLVDKSLVTASEAARAVEFRLLQTLAQYGREQLDRSGDGGGSTRSPRHVRRELGRGAGRERTARPRDTGTAPSVNCSTTSASRWSGRSSRATPTSRAPSPAGSVGSGTWAAASTTPGDGSRRLSHSESPPGRSCGSARSQWGGLVGMLHDSERAMEYGAEAVARARALGDDSVVAVATMLHASASPTSSIAPGPRRSCSRSRERAFLSVGDGWSRAMATLVGGCHLPGERRLRRGAPGAARSCGSHSAQSATRGAEPSRCATSPTSRPMRGRYDEAELALQQAILGCTPWARSPCRAALTAAPRERVRAPGPHRGSRRAGSTRRLRTREAAVRPDAGPRVQPARHHAAPPRTGSTRPSGATALRSRSASIAARPRA